MAIKDLKLSSGSSGVLTVNCSKGIYLLELIRYGKLLCGEKKCNVVATTSTLHSTIVNYMNTGYCVVSGTSNSLSVRIQKSVTGIGDPILSLC